MNEWKDKFFAALLLILTVGYFFYRASTGQGGILSSAALATISREDSSAMFQRLGGDSQAKPVTMFVTEWCPVCVGLRRELDSRKIPYLAVDVEKNPLAGKFYQQVTQGKTSGVPVTVVGSEVYLGYEVSGIVASFEKLG